MPARSRPLDGAVQRKWIGYGVREYRGNARRYRNELRRIDG
ncbi:hypothetical protein [Acrocarpospora pleiomorpha]|nr:hypothetical protein [Acrocarpospora pleiomorpha]